MCVSTAVERRRREENGARIVLQYRGFLHVTAVMVRGAFVEGRPGPRACAMGSTAAVRKHGRYARQERRDSAECIIQRRFAIGVDSVPSCKLGPARTRRPRVSETVQDRTKVTINH